jgi:S-adenosylmethionine:tRNA ribosyltransferase-isomerase
MHFLRAGPARGHAGRVRIEDLDYDLPLERIAQEPAARRDASRLLVLRRAGGALEHRAFRDLPGLLRPGDLLVLNDAAVFPARLDLRRATGGRFDALLLEPLPGEALRWEALVNAHNKLRPGERLAVERGEGAEAILEERRAGAWVVRFEGTTDVRALADRAGRVPLPPYIRRERGGDPRDPLDRDRYQTVFARDPVAAAAPTAGLHFTPELLRACADRGVGRAFVTLAVGPGTFRPVKTARLEDHPMHAERWGIPGEAAGAIRAARAAGGRVVAVGTTVVRTLEAAAAASPDGLPRAGEGTTDLFLLPGHRFRSVDALVTNFHLPRSTLLALVMAFAGREAVLAAYAEAVRERYRFFSYGDAMLLL